MDGLWQAASRAIKSVKKWLILQAWSTQPGPSKARSLFHLSINFGRAERTPRGGSEAEGSSGDNISAV